MTIESVDKAWSRSSLTLSSPNGYRYDGTITEAYQIVHTYDATLIEISSASSIPTVGQLYPGTSIPCTSVGNVQRIGPIYSIVVCEYKGETGNADIRDTPINQQPEPVWSDNSTEAEIDTDWDGNPIVTNNREPIHGVTMEIADQTLSITRNFSLFTPWLTHQYRHSVNSDVFYSYPPGTARLVGFSATPTRFSGISYWKVEARIQFRYPFRTTPDKAWYARVLHQGFWAKNHGANGPITAAIVPGTQTESTVPVLLKQDGTPETNPANAYYKEFKRYQSLPYSALGLY